MDPNLMFVEGSGGVHEAYVMNPGGDWKEVDTPFAARDFIRAFIHAGGLHVLVSALRYENVPWIHLSLSRTHRLPGYTDIVRAKDDFFGPDRYAAMVFPPKQFYVNIHPYVLHLYGPLHPERWPLPEFSLGSGSI